MSVAELREGFKRDRSRALDSLIGLLHQQDTEVIPNDEELARLEWDTEGGLNGVQTLHHQYYDELQRLAGSNITAPTLPNYTRAGWEARYRSALSTNGDGFGGLYPNGMDSTVINGASAWLNWNGYVPGSVLGLIDHSSLTHSADGDYVTYEQTGDPGDPPSLQTTFTKSSSRYTNLLSAFDTYAAFLLSYQTKWIALAGASQTVFHELGTALVNLDLEIAATATALQTLMDTVATQYAAAPASVVVAGHTTTIPVEYHLYRDALNALRAALVSRRDAVESFLATESITTDPLQTLRDLRVFTVTARLARLSGSYAKRRGMLTAIDSAVNSVKESNAVLLSVEQDYTKWLPTPSVTAAYYEEVRNGAQQVIRTENNLLANVPGHISQVRILRRVVNATTELSNIEWDQDTHTAIVDRSEVTGYIEKSWDEVITAANRGFFYLYRLQAVDGGAALPSSLAAELLPGLTSSAQSTVLGATTTFTKLQDILVPTQGWVTVLSGNIEQLGALKGGYVYMPGRGIRLVVRMTEEELVVYPALADAQAQGVGGSGAQFQLQAISGLINSYTLVAATQPVISGTAPSLPPPSGGGGTGLPSEPAQQIDLMRLLPEGGLPGTVLAKESFDDYDVEWRRLEDIFPAPFASFYRGPKMISESITLTADQNWMSIGPIEIDPEVEIVVEGNWVIV